MSDAEQNLVAWMRAQRMHDSADLVERLAAERDALRAELAAERECVRLWAIEAGKLEYERDALRELLRQARYSVQYELRARIDAALKND